MWTCSTCGRIFAKTNQPHSCQKVPVESHFRNKPKAKQLFEQLFALLNKRVGPCQIISLPCCIHLFGNYDFLAALPKKDRLEIRLALDHPIKSALLKQSVPLSAKSFKHCLDIRSEEEIDAQLLSVLKESYHR